MPNRPSGGVQSDRLVKVLWRSHWSRLRATAGTDLKPMCLSRAKPSVRNDRHTPSNARSVTARTSMKAGKDTLPLTTSPVLRRPCLEHIQVICPPLHHSDPFIPELRPSICATHIIALDMGELALDRVGMPLARLI
jgi:hypothetical protein